MVKVRFKNAHEQLSYLWAMSICGGAEVCGEEKTELKQCDWRFKLSDGRLAQIECKASIKSVHSDFTDAYGFDRRDFKSTQGSPEGRWLYNQIKEASEQLDPGLGPTMLLIPSVGGDLVFYLADVIQALSGMASFKLPNRTPVFDSEQFGSSRPEINQNISAIGIIRRAFSKNALEMVDRIVAGHHPTCYFAPERVPQVDIIKNPYALVEWPETLSTENDQVYSLLTLARH